MSRQWVDMADAELVVAAAGGNHDAFAVLHDRLAPWVYSRFLCEYGDVTDAQEATQDTLVEAWRALPGLREPRALRAWVGTIAQRRAMQSHGDRALRLEDVTSPADPAPRPDERAMQAEARQLVADALASLNPRYRTAVEFVMAHGRAGQDLGTVLGVDAAQASRIADKATHGLADAVRALVVARSGRGDCAGLDRILSEAGWTGGALTEELRGTVQRHIGKCTVCQPRREAAARTVMESLPVVFPFLVPSELRDRVLGETRRIAATSTSPSPSPARPRLGAVLAVAAVVLLILGALVLLTQDDDDPGEAAVLPGTDTEVDDPGDEPDPDLPATSDNVETTAPEPEPSDGTEGGYPLCSEFPGTSVEGDKTCRDVAGGHHSAVGYWECPEGLLWQMSDIDGVSYYGFEGGVWQTQTESIGGCPE